MKPKSSVEHSAAGVKPKQVIGNEVSSAQDVPSVGLKPCPFCGGSVEVQVLHDSHRVYGIQCGLCVIGPNLAENKEEDLVRFWNLRSPDAGDGEGCPDWTCCECGSMEGFTTITNGNPMDGVDYDLECNQCKSVEVSESPQEALNEMADKILNLREKAKAREAALMEVLRKAKEALGIIANRYESIQTDIFELCQPDKGNVFAVFDGMGFRAKEVLSSIAQAMEKQNYGE